MTRSNNVYDDDFNVWLRDRDIEGRMQVYMLDPGEVSRMPCAQLEQLIHHMSIDHHQALLVLHISLQGILYIVNHNYNKFKHMDSTAVP